MARQESARLDPDEQPDEDDKGSPGDRLDPELRTVAVVVVSASAVTWWPAFTLGAYGRVFFDQMLALWAVSTAVFIVALLILPGRVSRGRMAAMLLPSAWLVLSYLSPTGTPGHWERAIFWTAAFLTVLGGPLLAWLLIRIVLSDYTRLPRRRRAGAIAVVIFIATVSFFLGRTNPQFLTCNDFTISGNYAPTGCTKDANPLP